MVYIARTIKDFDLGDEEGVTPPTVPLRIFLKGQWPLPYPILSYPIISPLKSPTMPAHAYARTTYHDHMLR